MALVMFSCERDTYQDLDSELSTTSAEQNKTVLSILLEHGWTEAPTSRHKFCQLGDAGLIPCDGGTCVGFHNYRGHPFCVGCSRGGVIDSEAIGCTGLNGDFVLILGEIASVNPDINIDYNISDGEGETISSGNGYLVDKIAPITTTLEADSKYELTIFFR